MTAILPLPHAPRIIRTLRAFLALLRSATLPAGDHPSGGWSLVRLAQDGDSNAFGQLYQRHHHAIYRLAYGHVGDHHTAEDITSETFLRAQKRISTITQKNRDIRTWLLRITKNLIVDHYRSAKTRRELITTDLPVIPESGPETVVPIRESVYAAIRKLNPEQQECLILRFERGLSSEEIGRAMHRSADAIRALQYRALVSLARHLEEEE